MNREKFHGYILDNFNMDGRTAEDLLDSMLEFVEKHYSDENGQYNVLCEMLHGTCIDLTDEEIKDACEFKNVHPSKKYYEIELDHDARARELDDTDELFGECSICIVGERKPTIEEAEDFCKEEMKNAGFEYVIAIREIDKEEARFYFDEEREKELPVFGKTEDSFLQESEIERE